MCTFVQNLYKGAMKVISIKRELLAHKLMESFVEYCEDGNVAKRSTIFKVLNYKTYSHTNPLHRMIARSFLLQNDVMCSVHTGDFPEVLPQAAA